MAISNYGELKTAIENHLNRSDLTSRIPEFITLGESTICSGVYINGIKACDPLKIRENEKRVTASISTQYFDIPTDFIEMRNIQLNTSPVTKLNYLSPEQFDRRLASDATGNPYFYTIHGTEFELKPIPDTSYTIELTYFYRLSSFTDDSDTNTVLQRYPGIYLYSALSAAEPYIKNDKRIPTWATMFISMMNGLNQKDENGRFSGTTLRNMPDFKIV